MLPFKMRVTNDFERMRAHWFWGKEPETIAWIEEMGKGEVLWDVGANVGVYSLFAASRGISVRAFEPSHLNCEALHFNKRLNDFRNLVVLNMALGRESGMSGFKEYQFAGMSGHQLISGTKIQVYRGDDVRATRPQYIKIDTDGNEGDVLQGCERVLASIRSLCVEMNDWKIISWLGCRGFRENIRYTKLKRVGGRNVIFTRN